MYTDLPVLHRFETFPPAKNREYWRKVAALERNAELMASLDAAKVLKEGEFDAASLFGEIRDLLADRKRLSSMRDAMLSLAVPDAADRICGIILS